VASQPPGGVEQATETTRASPENQSGHWLAAGAWATLGGYLPLASLLLLGMGGSGSLAAELRSGRPLGIRLQTWNPRRRHGRRHPPGWGHINGREYHPQDSPNGLLDRQPGA
jgi:hypothetical protein